MPAEYGLKELCENDFFKNFYMYCKKLFHYCCGIEKDFFFPNYSGKLDNIKKDDIHHDNLTKDFFIKEINNHFSFDKELTIREDNDVDKNVIKVKLYDLLIGIEIMLPKLNAYIKYTEYKKSYEKQDLQSRISLEMDLLLFEPTNEHDNNTKKETGIELPAYSFSKEQRKILRKLGCLKLYDAIELLRELKNFTEKHI